METGIAAKELVPVVIAAVLWGPHWAGRHVWFHSDNEAVVTIIGQPLLSISWQGNTYMDRALSFGLGSVPKILNAVADFLAWVLHCKGVSALIHYLHDFLLFGPPGSNIVSAARAQVLGSL